MQRVCSVAVLSPVISSNFGIRSRIFPASQNAPKLDNSFAFCSITGQPGSCPKLCGSGQVQTAEPGAAANALPVWSFGFWSFIGFSFGFGFSQRVAALSVRTIYLESDWLKLLSGGVWRGLFLRDSAWNWRVAMS